MAIFVYSKQLSTMKMHSTFVLFFKESFAFVLLLVTFIPLFILSPEQLTVYEKEDGILESCSAICYLLSSFTLFYLFFKSKSDQEEFFLGTNRNYFFLFLGILFIFCFGEEISWGQRILKMNTPDWMSKINMQNETNIHNINIFHGLDENDNRKVGLAIWTNLERWFAIFWFFYCVLIPIFYLISDKAQNILRKIKLPIVPLRVGALFVFNYLIAKSIEKGNFFDVPPPIAETKENNIAILFLVISISFYFIQKKRFSEIPNYPD